MTRASIRDTIFPRYRPPVTDDANAPPSIEASLAHVADYLERLAKRVITFGGLLALVASAGTCMGYRLTTPSASTVAVEAQVRQLRDTVAARRASIAAAEDSQNLRIIAVEARIAVVEKDLVANLYISCELLRRIQPTGIVPQDCRPERFQGRR